MRLVAPATAMIGPVERIAMTGLAARATGTIARPVPEAEEIAMTADPMSVEPSAPPGRPHFGGTEQSRDRY
jgi:hypothetical protein